MTARTRFCTALISGFLVGGLATTLAMAKTALPKGDAKVEQGKVQGPPVAAPLEDIKCMNDRATTVAGNGVMTESGELYLLSSGGVSEEKGKDGKVIKAHRYGLHQIQPTTKKVVLALSLTHRPGAALVVYGNPVTGVAAVSFAGKEKDCLTGLAAITAIALSSTDAKAVRKKGNYQLLGGTGGAAWFETEKNKIVDMDLATFQTRTVATVPKGDTPLFLDRGLKEVVTFKTAGKKRGLARYKLQSSTLKETKKFAIDEKDRVISSGSRYAFIEHGKNGNSVKVKQVPAWTGVGKPKTSEIKGDEKHQFRAAEFIPEFDAQLVAIVGRGLEAKTRWARALVYSLDTGKLVHTVNAGTGRYVNFVTFDQAGKNLISEVVSHAGVTEAVIVTDLETKKDTELALSLGVD